LTIAKGKFQEWLTPDGLLRIEGWARDGLVDTQIATNMGISAGTLYEYQNRFPQIAEALKKGKAPADTEVENAMFKAAIGYEYEETVTEIVEAQDGTQKKYIRKVKKLAPPNVLAQIYWLKNRKPAQWRDKPKEEDLSRDEPLTRVLARWDDAASQQQAT
jgi:hypothetical protein